MEWKLDKSKPVCPQICEQICTRIALGAFLPDERLMSVREIALAAGVNPNTVQKAFEQLEERGILHSQRGSGWFVSSDISVARETVRELTETKTADYFAEMGALGMTNEEIKQYVAEWQKGDKT